MQPGYRLRGGRIKVVTRGWPRNAKHIYYNHKDVSSQPHILSFGKCTVYDEGLNWTREKLYCILVIPTAHQRVSFKQ